MWRLRGEGNATFEVIPHAFVYFEHPDTVPFELRNDTLFLRYDEELSTTDLIRYMNRESFSIISETGDAMVFDRVPE
ncbi:MAG: hypothetical protein ABIQ75_00390 [Flavobacteriales bacterium]